MRIAIATAALALLAGCGTTGATKVATDVQTLDKPVSVGCTIEWPKAPVNHVANVQLTGNDAVDLPLIWRAAEAELEERIAYELKLEAAARGCVKNPPPK